MSEAARDQPYSFEVRPLAPSFGAELAGVDLSRPLDDTLFAEIWRAFLGFQLLLFREQELPHAAQIGFARRFGEVQIHVMSQYLNQAFPELYTLSNLGPDGKPTGQHPDRGTMFWHTDNSWSKVTGQATMLYVEVAPAQGGGTEWADMYAAYERLDEAEKRRLAPLRAVHDLNFSRTRRHAEDPMTEEQRRQKPPVDHPIVRTHAETGRKCLYLGDHASHILGWPVEEGRAFVEELNARIVAPEVVYSHRWRARDFVVWDNRCLLHRALPYDTASEPRVIRRCTVLGQIPR